MHSARKTAILRYEALSQCIIKPTGFHGFQRGSRPTGEPRVSIYLHFPRDRFPVSVGNGEQPNGGQSPMNSTIGDIDGQRDYAGSDQSDINDSREATICVVGLGYVGLPLAVGF